MQVGVVDGPGKGCAESLMRGRRGEPLASSAETESVRAVLGGVQEFEFGNRAARVVIS